MCFKRFVSKFGLKKLQKVHTDNGREFVNNSLEDYVKSFSGKLVHGLPYKPSTQGNNFLN
jgi:hypothetical protein